MRCWPGSPPGSLTRSPRSTGWSSTSPANRRPRSRGNSVLAHAPDRPQVGEERQAEGGPQVGRAGGAAGAAPAADRPLHHLDVVVAPLLHALVQVDQELAYRGRVGVVVVDLLQHLL